MSAEDTDIRTKAAAAAARLLIRLLDPEPAGPVRVEVTVTNGRLDISVRVSTHQETAAAELHVSAALHLTPLDAFILESAPAEPVTMDRLARLCGHEPDSYFQARARRLRDLGLLVHDFRGWRRA